MTIKEQKHIQEVIEHLTRKEEVAEREYELVQKSNEATKVFRAKIAYYEAMAEKNGALLIIQGLEDPEEE